MSLERTDAADAEGAGPDVDVDELGRRLGEAIRTLSEYREFEQAKAAVEESDDLQERIADFERMREEFMLARQTGEATQEDVEKLERAQRDLHADPEMERYLRAQEELQDRLETVNEAVSEPLAVDFGGEAGGCCED